MSSTNKVIALLIPVIVIPLIGFLIAEDYLSLGAGDKDIAMLIPLVIWVVLFLVFGFFQWKKQHEYKEWIIKSTT